MAYKRNIIHIQVDDELLEQLDDFRFDNRFRNMSEAIRTLIKLGLKHYKKPPKQPRNRD
jgi:metal-responsive CopG/Arc/MetJ family transcriptional regulator